MFLTRRMGLCIFSIQSFPLPKYVLQKNDRTGHFAFGVIVVMKGHRPDCAHGPKLKNTRAIGKSHSESGVGGIGTWIIS